MKSVMIGIGIYILGFIIIVLCADIISGSNSEISYYYGIIFSILYLSAVVGISTSLILNELKNNQNH